MSVIAAGNITTPDSSFPLSSSFLANRTPSVPTTTMFLVAWAIDQNRHQLLAPSHCNFPATSTGSAHGARLPAPTCLHPPCPTDCPCPHWPAHVCRPRPSLPSLGQPNYQLTRIELAWSDYAQLTWLPFSTVFCLFSSYFQLFLIIRSSIY